jgi:GNAT superfamily N-acetyltransferase
VDRRPRAAARIAAAITELDPRKWLPVLNRQPPKRSATIETVTPLVSTRRATVDDVDAMLGHVQAGFDSYTHFAPPGWQPPVARVDGPRTRQFIDHPQTWALLALVDGVAVGHIAFLPAREWLPTQRGGDPSAHPPTPGLAHLWQLFVLPEWWGGGIAPLLHGRAIAEMRSRRFARARLFTPSLHARARRFYEHHGWTATEEYWNEGLQLMLCEYRLGLE